MKLDVFQITDKGGLQPCDMNTVTASLAQADGSFWITVEAADPAELDKFLQSYDLPGWVIERSLESNWKADVRTFDDRLFFELPVCHDLAANNLACISFIATPRLLITIHRTEGPHLVDEAGELQKTADLLEASIGGLLYWLIDHLFDVNIELFMNLRNQSIQASDAFDEEPGSVDIMDIRNLKKEAQHIEVMLEDQLYCVNRLNRTDWKAFLPNTHHVSLATIEEENFQLLREVRRTESRIQDLNQHYQIQQQEISNRRLNVLAIVQSVFVPLTLLAGLYGMNFKYMPELEWTYSYPVFLVVMLVLAIVILWLFQRKGWFN